jgi:hypothetical protein
MNSIKLKQIIREEIQNVLKEAVTLSIDGKSVTISSILVNKLKVAMDVRMRNPKDKNAHAEVEDILTQIYKKAGRRDAKELATGNMEDEVTMTGPLSAVVSLIKDTVSVPYLSSKDKQLIKKFKSQAVDNPTSTDVDFFSAKHNLDSSQRHLLKRVFLSKNNDIKITPTGPLPSDIKPRIGQIKKEGEISGMLNRLDKNKSLKVDDITTIKSGKSKGKKVKIVADLGGGSYGLEFVS